MVATVVLDLPPFDTGQYEGSEFSISAGSATLTIRIAGMEPFSVRFSKVRWHQFTALYNCTEEMVGDSYFRLVEYKSSRAVAEFIQQDQAGAKAYSSLSHYRIFLDETGCHEVFAESVAAL